jgi:hypothetical protein
MRRLKKDTLEWRLMQRYAALKGRRGSGKSIIATARKVAVIIWHMLSEDKEFNPALMVDRKLGQTAAGMSRAALCAEQAGEEEAASGEAAQQAQRVAGPQKKDKRAKKTGVTGEEKRKKAG